MDKLAKRAGVAMLVVVAAAGSAFAMGLARFASSVETERIAGTPHLQAFRAPPPPPSPAPAVEPARRVEEIQVAAPTGRPSPAAVARAPARRGPPTPVAVLEPAPASEDSAEDAPAPDMLDLDFGAHDREAKLVERSADAFEARQVGGAEEKHRRVIAGQRVVFETDLASPEPR
jgi:hypothetical protein